MTRKPVSYKSLSSLSAAEASAVISPHELAQAILARLPSVIFTALAVTCLIAGMLWVVPNRYASDGLFYARLGRGAVSIDPTTEPSRSVSLQDSRSSEVNSISEMLNSRELADRVVKKVGVREINFPRTWTERLGSKAGSFIPSFREDASREGSQMDRAEYDRQIAHEEAVQRFTDAVSITVPKNSYTVAVTAKSNDPILAQKMVQAIMDEYGAYHVEAHNSTGSLEFFERQTAASQAAAIAARKTLQSTKSEMGWMSTDSAEASLRERILNLELSLDQTNSEFAEAESKAESLAERLRSIDEWIPMETTKLADNAVDSMRTQLYGFKMEDGEELSKVTASHPRYKILRDKIIQGEEMVNSANDDREQTVEARNPLRLTLETDYQSAMTSSAGHRSRRDSLVSSLESARKELNRLNQDAVRLAELSWAADIAEKNYLSHSQSLESSRMMQELDNQNMSDVSIIQNASLNLKKVGPPRLVLTLIGAMFGLCLGLLQALVRDSSLLRQRSEFKRVASGQNPTSMTINSPSRGTRSINEELELEESRETDFAHALPR